MKTKNFEIFKSCRESLKELSKDGGSRLERSCDTHICDTNFESEIQYMTESSIEAIDFDEVKRRYTNSLGLSDETAASVDAVLETEKGICFIEFKNGKMKHEKRKVKDKIRDSLWIFCDITQSPISDIRENSEFILVYNIEKNPVPNQLEKKSVQESESRNWIAKHFLNKGGEEFIRFDLERFKTLYFKEVHTYTSDEFEAYLNDWDL